MWKMWKKLSNLVGAYSSNCGIVVIFMTCGLSASLRAYAMSKEFVHLKAARPYSRHEESKVTQKAALGENSPTPGHRRMPTYLLDSHCIFGRSRRNRRDGRDLPGGPKLE